MTKLELNRMTHYHGCHMISFADTHVHENTHGIYYVPPPHPVFSKSTPKPLILCREAVSISEDIILYIEAIRKAIINLEVAKQCRECAIMQDGNGIRLNYSFSSCHCYMYQRHKDCL